MDVKRPAERGKTLSKVAQKRRVSRDWMEKPKGLPNFAGRWRLSCPFGIDVFERLSGATSQTRLNSLSLAAVTQGHVLIQRQVFVTLLFHLLNEFRTDAVVS